MTTINCEHIKGLEPRGVSCIPSLDITVSMTQAQRKKAIVDLAGEMSQEDFATLMEAEFADMVSEWRDEGAQNAAEAYFEKTTGAHA